MAKKSGIVLSDTLVFNVKDLEKDDGIMNKLISGLSDYIESVFGKSIQDVEVDLSANPRWVIALIEEAKNNEEDNFELKFKLLKKGFGCEVYPQYASETEEDTMYLLGKETLNKPSFTWFELKQFVKATIEKWINAREYFVCPDCGGKVLITTVTTQARYPNYRIFKTRMITDIEPEIVKIETNYYSCDGCDYQLKHDDGSLITKDTDVLKWIIDHKKVEAPALTV